MDLTENAEEVLESIWTRKEEEGTSKFTLSSIGLQRRDDTLQELTKFDLITLSNNQISLTTRGQTEATNVIRRHRLAERLLVDVLDTESSSVEEAACKLEHAIRRGIDENICILLGHPKVCPHGKPIPKGNCCLKGFEQTDKIVVPLSQMKPDQEGRIAYIHAKGRGRLQKLMAMGVTPGMAIQVIQRFPSHVFQINQTQIAVDEEIANEIFILKGVRE